MTYLKTTNMLSHCFGPSPTAPYDVEAMKIKRGYIVYIEITSDKIFRIRQFYADFDNQNGGLPVTSQTDFENQVIELSGKTETGVQGNLDAFNNFYIKPIRPISPTQKRPFPYIFCDNIDEVHFGNIACNVTYIFNTPFFKFLNTAPNPANRPLDNEQPMVLRSSKMIRDSSGVFIEKEYNYSNDTFYNLNVDNTYSDRYSLLKFDNIMWDVCEKHGKEYCMDIYFDAPTDKWKEEFYILFDKFVAKLIINNPKIESYLKEGDTKLSDKTIIEFVEDLFSAEPERKIAPTNWVTMVFDPPQTNGGTGGPPN